ncbi:hypothetical protein MSG28_007490 [Choristoneura fumiferana]|uniref:Uncharacterized protein n=1 Tax=Choristoneura fumiferana TaxID=7141 RepID=A0ACC0JXK4_CHOFU|nr:hypothetical protein MSG28_007490 [Choristoneura fumiferana]
MKKSTEKISSDSSSEAEVQFSFKRYFINNLDSYHGEQILREMSKVLEKNVVPTRDTSMTVVAEDAEPLPPPPPELPYEIIGTVSDPKIKSLDNVARIVPRTEVLPVMLTCGTVVLDISYDREELRIATEYLKLLKDLLEKQHVAASAPSDADDGGAGESKKRYLILISTVMTWADTKPLDPDNPDMPFIEADFRKRKPHPNYKLHYNAESEVVIIARKYRTQIGALVVCAGVTYSGREDVLFFWFQKAWECERLLPILGRGGNVIPLINVLDLAQIYDLVTLNLNMEPTFIVETMGLQWTSDLPFAENVPALMKQFKKERGLKPFKIVVYGPPIVGKTTLSKQICEAYGLVYLSPETAAQDVMEDLEWRVAHWEVGETAALPHPTGEEEDPAPADDEEDEPDQTEAQEAARQTLAILQSGRSLSEEEVMGYLRQRLLCRESLNRGWVLDGFPTSLAQCATLFDKGEEQDSEAEEENEENQFDEDVDLYSGVLKKMLPDIVVYLEATDDFICEKAMRQPESDSRMDEETVLKRLSEFRAGDSRDITPLNFFDELDIHPLVVPVKEHSDYEMKGSYAAVALRMGRPCRYGKLLALIEAAEKRCKEEMKAQRSKEANALKEIEKKIREDHEDKMEYWSELYALMREEEEAALAAAGEPMRNYLVHHIFPTLTPALLEAEYLFKLNPCGKMLEPGYNLQAERILGKIKILDEALQELDIKIDPLVPPEADLESAATSKLNMKSMSAL